MPINRIRYMLIVALLGLMAAVLLWPSPVDAQCGTQASSCKNCHEVQGQDPVNADGAWHVDHAFGDFCEWCHAGNVTATDKDAAHQGMIYPLDDVKTNCSTCHPDDYEALAAGYASVLGVTLTTGESASSSDAEALTQLPDEAASSAEQPAGPDQTETVVSSSAGASDAGVELIDLNDRYEEAVARRTPGQVNVGNVILGVMLVGLVGVSGVLIWRFEGLGDRWAELRGRLPKPAPPMGTAAVASEAYQTLLPLLEKASPATLASIARLLEEDPQRGGQMIEALARIDPRLVEIVRRLDERDLDLLMVLVRELKDRSQ